MQTTIPTGVPPSPPSSPPHRTNTLILTSLPASLFHHEVLQALKDLFSSFGVLHSWAPIKGWGRIFVVYWDEQTAEDAKRGTDGLNLGSESAESPPVILRVYRGSPTTVTDVDRNLAVPPIEKNFLISPPGSPPVGWEPIKEVPPNTDTLAADLVAALHRLKISREGGVEILVSGGGEDGEGDANVPAVHLEGEWLEPNGDGGDEEVSRPPGGISMVKATVESMSGTSSAGGWLAGQRVPVQQFPTPRPPVLSGI